MIRRAAEPDFNPGGRSAEHGFTSCGRSAEHGFTSCGRSAEHGFTSCGRSAEHGFTLVELLVALAIFALIAAAGTVLLAQGVAAQGQVRARLDELASTQRTIALLTNDFAQAVPRVSRTEAGTLAPAFFAAGPAEPGRPLVQFVRAGWDNLDEAPRPSLQKLEYWLVGGQLQRRAYPEVDGAAPTEPAVLVEGVGSAQLHFRDDLGAWHGAWTPGRPDVLPTAVELTLAGAKAPPLTLLFLVGPGAAPPQPQLTRG